MRRALVIFMVLGGLTGCTFFTGVEASPQDCTLARAGADTMTVVVVNAAGDTVRGASVGWCRP